MPRKSKGLINDLMSITASLPWWVSVVLAVIAYLACNYFASAEIGAPVAGQGVSELAVKQITKTIATFAQYALPILFLGGALASVLGRRRREALLA